MRLERAHATWTCVRARGYAVSALYLADASQAVVDVLSNDAQIAAAASAWAVDAKVAASTSDKAAKDARRTMNAMLDGAVSISFAESSMEKDCELAASSLVAASLAARACFMVIGGVDPLLIVQQAGGEE